MTTSGMADMIFWTRRFASMDTLWWSYCSPMHKHKHEGSEGAIMPLTFQGMIVGFTSISCWAMLQAAPRPTASGVGTVPERRPRSCPPPLCSGSKRTRGRRRTYRAPTPVHTCVGGPVRRSGPGRMIPTLFRRFGFVFTAPKCLGSPLGP